MLLLLERNTHAHTHTCIHTHARAHTQIMNIGGENKIYRGTRKSGGVADRYFNRRKAKRKVCQY